MIPSSLCSTVVKKNLCHRLKSRPQFDLCRAPAGRASSGCSATLTGTHLYTYMLIYIQTYIYIYVWMYTRPQPRVMWSVSFLFFYFITTSSIECSIYDDDTLRHTVLLTKGLLVSISPMCTLSQNGYSEALVINYVLEWMSHVTFPVGRVGRIVA